MGRVFLSILLFGVSAQTQGDDFFAKGQYAEAASAFERLPEAQKTGAVFNRLAISYHLLNRFKEAEAAYRRAIRVEAVGPAAYNNLGALFYSQRKFGDADSEFRRASDRDAANDKVNSNLRFARHARDNERAAKLRADELAPERPLLLEPVDGDFLAVVSLLPAKAKEDAWIHETRGDTYAARKLFEDAVIEYRKSLALDRYNASAANRLGIAYHNLHKLREAEQQYREALRLRPNFLDALNNLAVIDYVRRDYDSALSRYTKALKLQPQSVTILRNLGACLFSMERWEEGTRVYEQALALNPRLFDQPTGSGGTFIQMSQQGNAMLNLHLAKIFAVRGDTDLAISYLYKAIEAGLKDVKLLSDDQAFNTIATDERFGRMLETLTTPRPGI